MPADEIVIGAPFYGHVFIGVHSANAGLFERFRKLGAVPSYARSSRATRPRPSVHWSTIAQEPWIYDHRDVHASSATTTPRRCRRRPHYAVSHHLRGVMLWEIAMDDADAQPARRPLRAGARQPRLSRLREQAFFAIVRG